MVQSHSKIYVPEGSDFVWGFEYVLQVPSYIPIWTWLWIYKKWKKSLDFKWSLFPWFWMSTLKTYLGMRKPNWQSSSNQSGLTTQIRTHPRATQQGHVKCKCHIPLSSGPDTGSNSRGRRIKNITIGNFIPLILKNFLKAVNKLLLVWGRFHKSWAHGANKEIAL